MLDHLIDAPLRLAIIGGSNSIIKTGYTAHLPDFLARLGLKTEITNLAIGANTCIRGLMTALDLRQQFDIVLCEYFVNDFTFARRHGVGPWFATFEAMLRVVRRANPTAIICVPLIGRRDERFWGTQDIMREQLLRLAEIYGAIVTDIDGELRRFPGSSLSGYYKDGGHYKAGITSSHAAALIATDLAFHLFRHRSTHTIDLPAVSDFDLEHATVHDIHSFYAGERASFNNSRYRLSPLKLVEGNSVSIPLAGAPLAIGYVSTPDACDLVCQKASGEQLRIHTIHKEVGSGRFPFLVRTMNLMIGDWLDQESCGSVILRALRHDSDPELSCFDEYNMLPNKTVGSHSVYVTSILQIVV